MAGWWSAFCGAKLRSGFDLIAENSHLEEAVVGADLVITGMFHKITQQNLAVLPTFVNLKMFFWCGGFLNVFCLSNFLGIRAQNNKYIGKTPYLEEQSCPHFQ